MNHEAIRENLEAYALSALEPSEMREVELHLRDCNECSQVVRVYQIAVDQLALAVPLHKAPPLLRQRILGGIGAIWPLSFLPAFMRTRWFGYSAAAVLISFAVGGLTWAIILSSQVSNLREDNARLSDVTQLDAQQRQIMETLQGQIDSARTEQRELSSTLQDQANLIVLALDQNLIPTLMQGTNLAPQATCNYVWSTQETVGALTCSKLPSVSFTLTYEFWAMKGEKLVPVATFLPQGNGTAQLLIKFPVDTPGPVSNLWVTLEPRGGGFKPSAQVVLQKAPEPEAQKAPESDAMR